jgi:hypothetical protein
MMQHTFKSGTSTRRRARLDGEDDVSFDPDDVYLFDMSDGVETLLSHMYERYARKGGPVATLATMSPDKQAALRAQYGTPYSVDLFLSRLRAGPRSRCRGMLAKLSTDNVQAFEGDVARDKRFTVAELRDTRAMINDEVCARMDRGERV